MTFRPSAYIDFDTGVVSRAPMELVLQRRAPWTVDEQLDVFECRVDVWQFGPAVEILKKIEACPEPSSWSHAAYALLAVTFSYFEMIGKTLNPKSAKSHTAGDDFNHGFCDVYPAFAAAGAARSDRDLPDVVKFRDRARNGMYHLAYTKKGLFIHNEPWKHPEDFSIDGGPTAVYWVNPHQMTRTIVAHFPTFMRRLRDPAGQDYAQLQQKFTEFFNDFHK